MSGDGDGEDNIYQLGVRTDAKREEDVEKCKAEHEAMVSMLSDPLKKNSLKLGILSGELIEDLDVIGAMTLLSMQISRMADLYLPGTSDDKKEVLMEFLEHSFSSQLDA